MNEDTYAEKFMNMHEADLVQDIARITDELSAHLSDYYDKQTKTLMALDSSKPELNQRIEELMQERTAARAELERRRQR